MSLSDLVAAFRNFMGAAVAAELSGNSFDDSVEFVFFACPSSASLEVQEAFWKRNIAVEQKTHRGLVRTGDGAKYLDQELQDHPEVNTAEYWADRDVEEGLSTLQELFNVAIRHTSGTGWRGVLRLL